MTEENQNNGSRLSHFDKTLGALDGLPDVVGTKATTLRVVPTFGIGTHIYVIQTFRQRDRGDIIFLEHVSENGTTRLVIPSSVADTIARQRKAISKRTRSKAMKVVAEDRMAQGLKPSFMKQGRERGRKPPFHP